MSGGEQVGRGVSAWRHLSRVHSATLLGMLQFVVYEVVATSQGVSGNESRFFGFESVVSPFESHLVDTNAYHSTLPSDSLTYNCLLTSQAESCSQNAATDRSYLCESSCVRFSH